MEYLIASILIIAVSAAALLGYAAYLKKSGASSAGKERDESVAKVNAATQTLGELLKYKDSFVSKEGYQSLISKLDGLKLDLASENERLKAIESTLDSAQKNVEERETKHQAVKTSREEDELKLQELLAGYATVTNDSVALEQKLAASLKNLDLLLSEVELTESQKAVVGELSRALGSAGERLRDLLTEFHTVKLRLETLQQQHADLETEYTRLVEQQLGD